eukprot:4597953-Pyramimonas_sp.AAC.1
MATPPRFPWTTTAIIVNSPAHGRRSSREYIPARRVDRTMPRFVSKHGAAWGQGHFASQPQTS